MDPKETPDKPLRKEDLQPLDAPPPRLTLDTDTQVFFYEQDCYPLSNFSAFRIRWEDEDYDTSEHVYQCMKFYNGAGIRPMIKAARSAHEAFKMAQQFARFRRPDWEEIRVSTMLNILREKVRQHEYVRRKLLSTGDKELVENSWRDSFWGWGPNRDGKNMLGVLWMQIRKELQQEVGGSTTV